MADPFYKRVEMASRRLLMRGLSRLVRRRSAIAPGLDFNRCTVLFIRQDSIGDVLVTTPLFAALKRHYPQMALDVLLGGDNYFVLDHNPHVRRRWRYRKFPMSIPPLIAALRRQRYDFLVDPMDNASATSTVLSLLAGARWTVGIAKENAYIYDVVVPLLSRRDMHIVERLAQLLAAFRIDPARERLQLEYEPGAEATAAAVRFWTRAGLDKACVIGLNISAGSEARVWGESNNREFLTRLVDRWPRHPAVVFFAPADADRARRIAEGIAGAVLAPSATFDLFAALIRRTALLVTPDTSAVHLAAAFQIPSVALFGQPDPRVRIWEPYGSPCRTIVGQSGDLRTISADRVLAAVGDLLAEAVSS